jgi:hypothetical protein
MKRASTLFFFLMIAAFSAAAVHTDLPTSICSEEFCGSRQGRIWNRFLDFSGLDYERTPGMYSGVCFHKSPKLDADRVHYGGILIEKANDRLFFDGRFSFYTENNPYNHLSVYTARQRFDDLFHPTHELEINPTFAFVELRERFVSRRYWFRQGPTNEALLVVGYFGPLHTILCELERNIS